MSGLSLFRSALALTVLTLFASCAEMPPTQQTAAVPVPTPPQGYWNGDGVPGAPKIVVSVSEQRAYFYKGKNLVGESTVSTGKPGFSTPPGNYTVVWKDADHVSTVFGDYVDDLGNVVKSNIDARKDSKPPGSHYDGARMPFAMFFRGGFAMHQGYVPPYAASHGCIRLPQGMAETFFNAAALGTPVIVKQEAVTHVRKLPPLNPSPSPGPDLPRSTLPVPVRVTSVPTPAPSRAPVPIRAPSPAPVRSLAPVTARSNSVRPSVPAPTPVPVPVRSPSTVPVRSLAPASVHPKPAPVHSRKHRRVRSHDPSRATQTSPAPTPVQ